MDAKTRLLEVISQSIVDWENRKKVAEFFATEESGSILAGKNKKTLTAGSAVCAYQQWRCSWCPVAKQGCQETMYAAETAYRYADFVGAAAEVLSALKKAEEKVVRWDDETRIEASAAFTLDRESPVRIKSIVRIGRPVAFGESFNGANLCWDLPEVTDR